mmetsp:Transcript_7980/g.17116  ORF Transcript_7980/g.17116 Transcript_7980/m.17116 type:complete len:538 (+) Transcript_7980:138-1751(+)
MKVTELACDYLVVGAGAASIAFIDTLLTKQPLTKIILVDKNPCPGGHWVHAYGFVRLHQPSLLYGVASRQLEGNWLKLMLGKLTLPWHHRASKDEILKYYDSFIQDKISAGQVQYFPNCQYNFPGAEPTTTHPASEREQIHSFSSLDGARQCSVKVKNKLINGILGECIIPSLNPVDFPVDQDIQMLTPNQIFDCHHQKTLPNYGEKHFVVLGCGKTAMDTVVYLQQSMKVKPSQISWVIPNDVWMLAREGSANPWAWPKALLKSDHNAREAGLALERAGGFVRLDPNIEPTRFRFPVVGRDEIKFMRKVEDIIRRGRVTAIRNQENRSVIVHFGENSQPWVPKESRPEDLVFIHCTCPGPENGNSNFDLFASDHQLNLNLLFAPPVPISMSVLAYLESARINGTLDLSFGRQLLRSLEIDAVAEQGAGRDMKDLPENEVLGRLISGIGLNEDDKRDSFQSILNLALFLAIANEDPMVGYQFLKENRLSFFSIPGFKGEVYETMGILLDRAKPLGYSDGEKRMFQLLRDRLQILEGK